MEVQVSEYQGCTVCRPVGELDAFTVGGFRERLAGFVEPSRVVIDLTDVPFMDSSGLGALIGGIRRLRDAGGAVGVVCTRPAVLRLLHTTGFDRIVEVSETVDDAVGVIEAAAADTGSDA